MVVPHGPIGIQFCFPLSRRPVSRSHVHGATAPLTPFARHGVNVTQIQVQPLSSDDVNPDAVRHWGLRETKQNQYVTSSHRRATTFTVTF